MRYALFAGGIYYPAGGAGDFRGAFETLEEAQQAAEVQTGPHRWWHIAEVDSDGDMRIVDWWGDAE